MRWQVKATVAGPTQEMIKDSCSPGCSESLLAPKFWLFESDVASLLACIAPDGSLTALGWQELHLHTMIMMTAVTFATHSGSEFERACAGTCNPQLMAVQAA